MFSAPAPTCTTLIITLPKSRRITSTDMSRRALAPSLSVTSVSRLACIDCRRCRNALEKLKSWLWPAGQFSQQLANDSMWSMLCMTILPACIAVTVWIRYTHLWFQCLLLCLSAMRKDLHRSLKWLLKLTVLWLQRTEGRWDIFTLACIPLLTTVPVYSLMELPWAHPTAQNYACVCSVAVQCCVGDSTKVWAGAPSDMPDGIACITDFNSLSVYCWALQLHKSEAWRRHACMVKQCSWLIIDLNFSRRRIAVKFNENYCNQQISLSHKCLQNII